jgi:hypothetical protein
MISINYMTIDGLELDKEPTRRGKKGRTSRKDKKAKTCVLR